MKDEFQEFSASWVKKLRLQLGYTQEQFASAIGATAVTISRWERGVEPPSLRFRDKLIRLSKGQTEKRSFNQLQLPGAQFLLDPGIPFHSGLPARGLIGREALLEKCKRWLQSHTGIVVLQGTYGVGKTSLAAALALDKEVQAYFPQGILWASLGPNPNIFGHLSRWGGLLGIPSREMARFASISDWKKKFLTTITSQRLLLIIDDVWDSKFARQLLIGGSQCVYLITTHLEKQVDQLARQDSIIHVGELDSSHCLELLEEFAPEFIQEKSDEAKKLIQVVGGSPFALTIMGKYLQWQLYEQDPLRIQKLLETLRNIETQVQLNMLLNPSDLFIDASPQLLSTIKVNIEQLDEKARNDLFALLVFPSQPNTFSEEAAKQVCNVSLENLDQLVKTGLLKRTADRYSLDQTIIDYAKFDPYTESQLPRLRECMVEFFVSYIQRNANNYNALELEADNILIALKLAGNFAKEQEKPVFLDVFIQGVNALAPFLASRGMYVLVKDCLKNAKKVARQLDEELLMMVYFHLGRIAELGPESEELDEAINYYESGLKIANKVGDEDKKIQFLLCLGEVCSSVGSDVKAEYYLWEGLHIIQGRTREEQRTALFLNNLGEITSTRGNVSDANDYYRQAFKFAQQVGDLETESAVLQNLGVNAERSGEYAKANSYYQEGLQFAARIGHKQRESAIKMNMGMLSFKLKNYVKARQLYQESLELAQQIRHPIRISSVLQNLGMLERKLRNYSEATGFLRESLKIAYEINHAWLISETLCEWGLLYIDQEMTEPAQEAFDRALQKAIEIEGKELIAIATFGLAQVAHQRGGESDALEFAKESQRLFQEMGNERYKEVALWLQEYL